MRAQPSPCRCPPAALRHKPYRPLSAIALLVVALVAAASASACARRILTPEGERAAAQGDTAKALPPLPLHVFVSVENRNWSDVVVSIVRADGQVTRLGTVSGSQSVVLRFPGEYIAASARLHLIARPVGGRAAVRSEGFTVQPGQRVVWTLESSLQRSMISVY